MIFYMCHAKTPQLAATQADAKASGARWDQHDVPTDKPGLMGYVNSLLARIAAGAPLAEPEPEPVVAFKQEAHNTDRKDDCPGCHRSALGAAHMAASETLTEIEERIHEWPAANLAMLTNMEEAIAARRAELAEQAAKVPAIRKRVRK